MSRQTNNHQKMVFSLGTVYFSLVPLLFGPVNPNSYLSTPGHLLIPFYPLLFINHLDISIKPWRLISTALRITYVDSRFAKI